jgi:tellurite resistance protein TerC
MTSISAVVLSVILYGFVLPCASPNSKANRVNTNDLAHTAWRRARRVIVFVVGMTVVLAGLALTVLPGPAFVVIPAGIAILATEFVWAKRWLRKIRAGGGAVYKAIGGGAKQDKSSATGASEPNGQDDVAERKSEDRSNDG